MAAPTSSTRSATSKAEQLGIAEAYGDYPGLLEDPEIEVVPNYTRNYLHSPDAKAALESGKHVVSEKSLATSSYLWADLVKLAAASGVVTALVHNYRHYPLIQEAKVIVREGKIGRVVLVHGSYTQDWLLYADNYNWRVCMQTGGPSRAFADIGSHWRDLVQHIAGLQIVGVVAHIGRLYDKRLQHFQIAETFDLAPAEQRRKEIEVEIEDFCTVLLGFQGGASGALVVSQVSPGRKNHLYLQADGTEGSIAWDQERPDELWLGSGKGANRCVLKDPPYLSPEVLSLARLPASHSEGWLDALINFMVDVYVSVAAGIPLNEYTYNSFTEGNRELLIVEAVLTSHREGHWVKIQ